MASPTAAVITATGISAPTYAQIYAYLQSQYLAIFGADAYIDPDSQDGQMLAVYANAINDANNMAIAVYNSFSPATAQGVGLSSNVQINGLQRLVPTFSTAAAVISGTPNAVITNGGATDPAGNAWTFPTPITIPASGSIATVATCSTPGSISLAANALSISTPTFGWTGLTNSVGVPGNPTETDAALRVRQANSVALPSQSIFEGIVANIENVPGVNRVRGYENNTASALALAGGGSLPANNLLFVVDTDGSTAFNAAIFNAIFLKITPGIPTWAGAPNNQSATVTDANGSTRLLNFALVATSNVALAITLHALPGWSPTTEALIQAALGSYLLALPIGATISYFGLVPIMSLTAPPVPSSTPYVPPPQAGTFEIISYTINGTTVDANPSYNVALYPNASLITFTMV